MKRVLVVLCALSCRAEYAFEAVVDVDPSLINRCAFDPVEGAAGLSVYSCNPVFTSTAPLGAIGFGELHVAGHAFYQLWYADTERVTTAVSADGTTWEPYPGVPWREQAWDDLGVQNVRVAWDPSRQAYYMLYHAFGRDPERPWFGVGQATSEDGLSWNKLATNPVFASSYPVDDVRLSWPVDYEIEDGVHRAMLAAGTSDSPTLSLYALETREPGAWTEPPRLVLAPGAAGTFDDEGFLDADFVELDGRLYVFYVAIGRWEERDDGTVQSRETTFGARVSDDGGTSWRLLFDGPIPIDHGGATSIAARVVGSRIHLWATDTYEDGPGVGYFVFEPVEAG